MPRFTRESFLKAYARGRRDFRGIRWPDASLDEEGDSDGLTIPGCDFRGAELERASFVGSNLADADFREANVRHANFARANLNDAQFDCIRSGNRVVTACVALSQSRAHGRAKAKADARGARGMGEASRAVA
jgi:uncharacterized protein YjbI with pentapeptide repeats